MIFETLKVILQWRSAKQRRIYQSSWIPWPIRLWLLWGIVLCKEMLCKTWIVFILKKCICFIIKTNHVWNRVKNALKTHCFPKKPIVFQHVHFFIPLFWNEKLSLVSTHCVETVKKLVTNWFCQLNRSCSGNASD